MDGRVETVSWMAALVIAVRCAPGYSHDAPVVRDVFGRIDGERTRRGFARLASETTLARAAQSHTRWMARNRTVALILAAAPCWFFAAPARAQKFVPTNQFAHGTIQGFEVMIHTKILDDEKLGDAIKMETARQLHHIEQSIPAEPLKVLRQVRVWIIRHGQPGESSATYHPDPRWLRDHGYNPDMGGGIGVPDAERFLEFSKTKHFNILLHEMAHAYEFRVLGPENADLKAAYQRAMNEGLYRDTYHRTSHHEYFAELTEAYFGRNDDAPRTKDEARTYDPRGVELLERAWKVK